MKISIFTVFLLLSCIACTFYNHTFLYDFEKGIEVLDLDHQLDEISGLFYKNSSTLYAVQDEEGEIFEIDTKTGEHNKIIDFKKEGDFEGVVELGGTFYVLESDGDIFKVNADGTDEKFDFFSDDKDFEFEGLALDKENNNLLVSCKNHGKKEMRDHLFIYSFSLSDGKYIKEPYLKIPKSSIHKNFKASGITVGPEGHLFLISAISLTIVEITAKGQIVNKAQLPSTIYNQVEGICFGENKILYISSEKSKGDKAKIIKIKAIEK